MTDYESSAPSHQVNGLNGLNKADLVISYSFIVCCKAKHVT
jgi:hypothetical protein